MLLAPLVTFKAVGGHRVKAFTGPADQCRQEVQWQYPIATGSPLTENSTAPQKHLPLCSAIGRPHLLLAFEREMALGDLGSHLLPPSYSVT